MKNQKTLKIITVIQLIALLVVASYSWFSDKSNPSISENDIKVSAAEGLVIKLSPDSEARIDISLSEIMDQYNQFELKQISSADAIDFYYIDFGQGLSQGDPQFVQVEEVEGVVDMVLYGYIDYDFYLQAENFPKHVYFHKDTAYTGDASEALRIAISITQGQTTTTHIFGSTAENGISNPFTTEAIVAEGYFTYNNIESMYIDNQVVELISSFDGGRGTSDDDPIDEDELLVDIPANTQVQVNVKIWLEGGDVDCDASIASTFMDLLIKFGSANILLDAPTLTPDNLDYSITGLTTSMEWAYTNTPSTVWTTVTDPDMTFGTGQTVYVRIAEVPDVSPTSEVATVVFS